MKKITDSDILSPKQRACLSLLKDGKLSRINILQGSVRSGKTYVSLILWAFWIATVSKEGAFLMAGKTLSSLKRNILMPLMQIFGEDNFEFSLSKKEALLFGRLIYLEGTNDTRSEGKIRGMTLLGAYCDELSLFDEDFFAMLLSRLSESGAKLFATTNPDHPNHWLKTKYLDNPELDILNMNFTLDDNIFLNKKYVENLKKEYKGMYYKRFILGEWVAAEGRIYESFESKMILKEIEIAERLLKNPLILTTCGVDYGGHKSASVFCLVGFDKGFENVYLLDEYYDKENRSAEHLISAFKNKISGWKISFPTLRTAYCDSAEQLLVKSFRSAVSIEVKNAAKKPIISRINMLCRLMSGGRFFVSERCTNFINAVQNAMWDDSKSGADTRLDNGSTNIDSLDAFEYAIERFEKELFIKGRLT